MAGRPNICGCILIGGQSRRMGQAKATLMVQGIPLLQRLVKVLQATTKRVVLAGTWSAATPIEEVLGPAAAIARLEDDPQASGPIAGVVSAISHEPSAAWLCIACDFPAFDEAAAQWLIAHAGLEWDATVVRLPGRERPEPIPAIYGPTALAGLRAAIERRDYSLGRALGAMRVRVVDLPPADLPRWASVNTPDEWAEWQRQNG